MKKIEEVLATGRRKCAVARVCLSAGTGKVTLNGKDMTEYFPSEALCNYVAQVFKEQRPGRAVEWEHLSIAAHLVGDARHSRYHE